MTTHKWGQFCGQLGLDHSVMPHASGITHYWGNHGNYLHSIILLHNMSYQCLSVVKNQWGNEPITLWSLGQWDSLVPMWQTEWVLCAFCLAIVNIQLYKYGNDMLYYLVNQTDRLQFPCSVRIWRSPDTCVCLSCKPIPQGKGISSSAYAPTWDYIHFSPTHCSCQWWCTTIILTGKP